MIIWESFHGHKKLNYQSKALFMMAYTANAETECMQNPYKSQTQSSS